MEDQSRENVFSISLVPRLEDLTLIKIASCLCTSQKLKEICIKMKEQNGKRSVKTETLTQILLSEIKTQVDLLPLPLRMTKAIYFVVVELQKEIKYGLWRRVDSRLDLVEYIYLVRYTFRGRVDHRATLKLVMEKGTNSKFRKWANSFYCLKENGDTDLRKIHQTIKELNREDQNFLSSELLPCRGTYFGDFLQKVDEKVLEKTFSSVNLYEYNIRDMILLIFKMMPHEKQLQRLKENPVFYINVIIYDWFLHNQYAVVVEQLIHYLISVSSERLPFLFLPLTLDIKRLRVMQKDVNHIKRLLFVIADNLPSHLHTPNLRLNTGRHRLAYNAFEASDHYLLCECIKNLFCDEYVDLLKVFLEFTLMGATRDYREDLAETLLKLFVLLEEISSLHWDILKMAFFITIEDDMELGASVLMESSLCIFCKTFIPKGEFLKAANFVAGMLSICNVLLYPPYIFKKDLLDYLSYSRGIIALLILSNDYDTVDEILDFCLSGNQENISSFKKEFVWKNGLSIVVDLFADNGPADLEKYLSWSFNDNVATIASFKRSVINRSFPQSFYYNSNLLQYFNSTKD